MKSTFSSGRKWRLKREHSTENYVRHGQFLVVAKGDSSTAGCVFSRLAERSPR